MKTSELTGAALNWAVAKGEGLSPIMRHQHMRAKAEANSYTGDPAWHLLQQVNEPITVSSDGVTSPIPNYLGDWAQGGPILNNAKISRTIDDTGLWIAYSAYNYAEEKQWMHCDRSELVAGLRCFVESQLGDEVDVPEELL